MLKKTILLLLLISQASNVYTANPRPTPNARKWSVLTIKQNPTQKRLHELATANQSKSLTEEELISLFNQVITISNEESPFRFLPPSLFVKPTAQDLAFAKTARAHQLEHLHNRNNRKNVYPHPDAKQNE